VVGTHHVGASTQQAQEAVVDGVEEVIDAFTRGEPLHVVNALPVDDHQVGGRRPVPSGAAQ
jgi:D-3-phosphoglycerate dehydrogenase